MRSTGVIHRTQKVIQGDDNGHVVRPGEVSLAPPWCLVLSAAFLRGNGVCVYYCRTYYKAVRGGGRRRVEDMCYVIVLVLHRGAVTVSSAGPRGLFKDDNAMIYGVIHNVKIMVFRGLPRA